MDIAELYKKQISLTEWLEGVNHDELDILRKEDNDKRFRLELLHEHAGIQVDEVFHFSGEDLVTLNERFLLLYEKKKDKQCALRLVPTEDGLPKLRMRGMTLQNALDWSKEQNYDPKKYRVEVVSVPNKAYFSTIFVVTTQGIFGEIITGAHYKLTQGFYEGDERPHTFSFIFDTTGGLVSDTAHGIYEEPLEEIRKSLYVENEEIRNILQEKLDAKFCHNYLMGYFETVTSDDYGLWYIDYNRLLGDKYLNFIIKEYKNTEKQSTDVTLQGYSASTGKVSGKVRLISVEESLSSTFVEGEILVCKMTTPHFMHLIMKAGAIVTDDGGILSHAAIICRELHKPCVVGTKIATRVLNDGDLVEVDADNGLITIINKV